MKNRQLITAVILDKRGNILSIGRNSYLKTHPLQASYARKVGEDKKIYLHAEVHAIIRCQDLSRAYKILITRFDKFGNPRLAKPCAICENAIKDVGIKIIEHT